jgi:hypothetical protein
MWRNNKVHAAIWIIVFWFSLLLPDLARSFDPEDAPETVTIDGLSDLYESVEFNHNEHAEMATCSDCHHHTVGTVPTRWNCIKCHENSPESDSISCGDCHPRDRFGREYLLTLDNPELFHKETPGLKGAYHLNCIGCHQETGGPTGCEDCHALTDAGEKRFHAGKYAPATNGTSNEERGH